MFPASQLKAKLAEVGKLDENLYTKDSWKELQDAVKNRHARADESRRTQKTPTLHYQPKGDTPIIHLQKKKGRKTMRNMLTYVNGTLVVDRDASFSRWTGLLINGNGIETGVAAVELHDGDEVVLARVPAPNYKYYTSTIPAAPYETYTRYWCGISSPCAENTRSR